MAVAELFIFIWDFFFHPKCTSEAKLRNKTVIITGGNAGIGKETAQDLVARGPIDKSVEVDYSIPDTPIDILTQFLAFERSPASLMVSSIASTGAKVIIGCRDTEKGEKAAEDIRRQVPAANVIVKHLDLASFSSIRQFATEILKSEPRIHILINNAGIMLCPESKTVEGFEMHIGVNHLGHFLLTNLLLDRIKASAPTRIVNVSSMAYTFGKVSLDDINMERGYNPFWAYGQSKLANILFTRELARRLEGTDVTTYCLHPGSVETDLYVHLNQKFDRITGFLFNLINKLFFKSPKQGAQTTIYCSVDEKIANESGLYYMGCRSVEPMAKARDDAFAKKFWEFSEHLIESVYHSS